MFTLRGRGIRASIDVLGSSAWVHVEGSVEEKWCREEGDEVLRMLRQLRQAHLKPDISAIPSSKRRVIIVRRTSISRAPAKVVVLIQDWAFSSERFAATMQLTELMLKIRGQA